MPTYDELEELAKEQSHDSRRELMRRLTDMFLENLDDNTDEQEQVFADIVNRVLDDVVDEAREDFATRVATLDQFPHDVVIKLAWDSFEVASPILEHSNVLSDDDLVEIAKEQSGEHLLAISRRHELAEPLTDVLIEKGDDDVVRSVAGNPGAQFSSEGFDALANKARDDKKLQAKLVGRDDVTPEVAAQLEPYLSAHLKKRLSKKIADNESDVTNLVVKARKRVEQALKGKKRDHIDAQALVAEIQSGDTLLNDVVEKLSADSRPRPLAAVLAELADLPERIISNTVLKINGMPLAIACKSLDISTEAFAEITKMRCKVLKLPISSGERLAVQYVDLDAEDSRRTMRFLKARHSVEDSTRDKSAA